MPDYLATTFNSAAISETFPLRQSLSGYQEPVGTMLVERKTRAE